MIIQLLSDLHLEFHRDGGQSFIESLDPSGVDVLVVAGDIHSGERGLINSVLSLCALYQDVVFVEGNHEFYGWSPHQVHHRLRMLHEDVLNFHWLRHSATEIGGVRFAGTTLWFPRPDDPMVMLDRHRINDFHLIKGFEPWVYDEHHRARRFLDADGPRADVIVTHHMPSYECVARRFRGLRTNHYFTTDMTHELDAWQPKLWCFGHTHDRMWMRRGKTLLACNPFGYPMEQSIRERGRYVEKCLIEITSEGAEFVGDVRPGWGHAGPLGTSVDGDPVVRSG